MTKTKAAWFCAQKTKLKTDQFENDQIIFIIFFKQLKLND